MGMRTSLHGRKFGLDDNGKPVALGRPANIVMAAAAGGSNVAEVTCTVVDHEGNTVPGVWNFELWLSDASTGAGLTATTASGAVAQKTSSGEVLGALTSKKALLVQTLATGIFILSITDTAKTAFKVCARIPGYADTVVGVTLATGNYG